MSVKRYLTQQTVVANECIRGEYLRRRGWPLPADEKAEDEGYLITRINGEAILRWIPKAEFEKYYRDIGRGEVPAAGSHVERMIVERDDLKDKLEKLTSFTQKALFKSLAEDAQEDLRLQQRFMLDYLTILSRRITNA